MTPSLIAKLPPIKTYSKEEKKIMASELDKLAKDMHSKLSIEDEERRENMVNAFMSEKDPEVLLDPDNPIENLELQKRVTILKEINEDVADVLFFDDEKKLPLAMKESTKNIFPVHYKEFRFAIDESTKHASLSIIDDVPLLNIPVHTPHLILFATRRPYTSIINSFTLLVEYKILLGLVQAHPGVEKRRNVSPKDQEVDKNSYYLFCEDVMAQFIEEKKTFEENLELKMIQNVQNEDALVFINHDATIEYLNLFEKYIVRLISECTPIGAPFSHFYEVLKTQKKEILPESISEKVKEDVVISRIVFSAFRKSYFEASFSDISYVNRGEIELWGSQGEFLIVLNQIKNPIDKSKEIRIPFFECVYDIAVNDQSIMAYFEKFASPLPSETPNKSIYKESQKMEYELRQTLSGVAKWRVEGMWHYGMSNNTTAPAPRDNFKLTDITSDFVIKLVFVQFATFYTPFENLTIHKKVRPVQKNQCYICKINLIACDYECEEDKICWSAGLQHYIHAHGVLISEEFYVWVENTYNKIKNYNTQL